MQYPPVFEHHGSMFVNFDEEKIDKIIEELKSIEVK